MVNVSKLYLHVYNYIFLDFNETINFLVAFKITVKTTLQFLTGLSGGLRFES